MAVVGAVPLVMGETTVVSLIGLLSAGVLVALTLVADSVVEAEVEAG